MRAVLITLALAGSALAALNGRCTGNVANPHKTYGICVKTSTCKTYKGTTVSGGCPSDGDDIKCCYIDTCYDGREDNCQWTNQKCEGEWQRNHCPGGDNYSCCDTIQ